MAWPYLGPFPREGPIREENPDLDPVGGHPTAQGPTDRDARYPTLPAVAFSPGNGVPGRPRYNARADRHGKVGGMLPGPTPSGPQQPGVDYDSGTVT